jgi:hypothetical protein
MRKGQQLQQQQRRREATFKSRDGDCGCIIVIRKPWVVGSDLPENAKAASAKLLNRGLVESVVFRNQLIHKTGAARNDMHDSRSG